LRIRFHPSVQLFLSRWNVVEMWQAIKAGRSPPAPENGDFSWLVWRNEERLTEFCSLAATDLSLVEASLGGQDFASLCELLLTEVDETEVATTLVASVSRWLDQGLICGLGQGGLSP
jgi:hypothetical protein